MGTWDGEDYQRRIEAAVGEDADPHGEADFVAELGPDSVLDAGCGTGRVAIELGRRGIDVVGVDRDASMLATAERLAPDLEWVRQDLVDLRLGRRFDVVVMAGNVPLYTPAGTTGALVAGCARHLADGGALVAGFQLGRGYGLERYDREAEAAGLNLAERWATWDRDPPAPDAGYAVSVHRPVSEPSDRGPEAGGPVGDAPSQ